MSPAFIRSRHGTRWFIWDMMVGFLAFTMAWLLSPRETTMAAWWYFMIVGGTYGLTLAVCARFCGVPRPDRHASRYEYLSTAILAVLIAYPVFAAITGVLLLRTYGRWIVLYTVVISLVLLLLPRLGLQRYARANRLKVLVYGAASTGKLLLERLLSHPSYQLMGVMDNDPAKHGTTFCGLPVLGSLQTMGTSRLREMGVEVVVICVNSELREENARELLELPLHGIDVLNKGAFIEHYFQEISVEYTNPHWFTSFHSVPGNESIFFAKRVLDLCGAIFGLLVSAPAWPLVALAIKLDSKGPIFYTQKRVGLNGEHFEIIKFRSMRTDAEVAGAQWATKNDPRITRLGRFLRLSRLDEIPQLLNVLRGDMSLVGPRPERPEFVAELAKQIPHFQRRHLCPPGLTGWAQISYQYGASVDDAKRKLQFDLYYIRHLSLAFDLRIILKTVPMLMKGSR